MQPGDYCKISTGETLCFLLDVHLNSDKRKIFISEPLQFAMEVNVQMYIVPAINFASFIIVLVSNG